MNEIQYKSGLTISTPGLYAGIPIETYHGALVCDGPSISSSGLRTIFNDSPAHYWCGSPLNPDRIEAKENEAFVLGRATHHMILGEANFNALFSVRPAQWDSWRTGDARKWRDEQRGAGITVLEPKHIERIRGMAAQLAKHPLVNAGLLRGSIERSMIWRDAETSIWLKSRPDAIPGDSADFVDLKTTTDLHDDALARTIADCGYHMQGALVGMACREVLGLEMSTFSLCFVEKDPPHCVRVKTLKQADIERGERQIRSAVRTFAECLKSGEWPGPGGTQTDAEYIELPGWSQSRIDAQLAQGIAA